MAWVKCYSSIKISKQDQSTYPLNALATDFYAIHMNIHKILEFSGVINMPVTIGFTP